MYQSSIVECNTGIDMAFTLSSTKFRLLLGVCLCAILINVAGIMSFGGGTENKVQCTCIYKFSININTSICSVVNINYTEW